MRNRVVFSVALTLAVILLPRAFVTLGSAVTMFPISEGDVVVFDVEFGLWVRAAFIAAHAFLVACFVLIRRGNATLQLKPLALVLLGELTAIYVGTLLFWRYGVYASLY